jgi:hypothetical protein
MVVANGSGAYHFACQRVGSHLSSTSPARCGLQMALASVSSKILREGMTKSDERTKLESDVVTGIEAADFVDTLPGAKFKRHQLLCQ